MTPVDVKVPQTGDQMDAALRPDYPLITIAIPTYNRAELVKGCVESALAQSYRNVEVMVSDNASPDNTLEVLKTITDKRLRVLTSPENVGPIENHAKCVREARGDYVVLVSDDNLLDSRFLEKCAQMIKQEPGLPIVMAAYDNLIIDEFYENERRVVPPILSKKLSTGIWNGIDVLREYFQGKISADSLSVVVRSDILRRNNRYSMEYPVSPDKATWIPALLEGRAGLINECCATYMVHNSSLSSQISADDRLKDFCKMMDEISAIAEQKIPDRAVQTEVKKLSLRYLAYQAMVTLVLYRREGAGAAAAIRKFWNWRRALKQCSMMDYLATMRLRSVGRILLPMPLFRLSMALGLDKLNR
jgi:glycosyltransferase involved in cell wall biosynthesis